MSWVLSLLAWIWKWVHAVYRTDVAREHTVHHMKKEVLIDDRKTDAQRMRDLGL